MLPSFEDFYQHTCSGRNLQKTAVNFPADAGKWPNVHTLCRYLATAGPRMIFGSGLVASRGNKLEVFRVY
jgi:hypothetical protein